MRILCLNQDFLPHPGGIAMISHNLYSQLSSLGHEVDVLAPKQEKDIKTDVGQAYRVYRYESWQRLSSAAPIYHILSLHQQHRYDAVFLGHFMTTHALGALLLHKLWGVPYVIYSYGNDLDYSVSTKIDQWVAHLLLDNAALMLGCSRFVVGLIRETGYKGPAEVLNPGVDSARFNPSVDTTEVRQRYNLNGRRILLTTARLVAKKNVDGVLRALPKVIKKVSDVLYLVVGAGEERKQLEALCDELGLRHYVRFLGHIENNKLPALHCASNVFVMPSIETFGVSFIEANACGKPVIGGRSGGITDAIVDEETGLLVDPHNVEEIAAAIIRLLTNRELARRLGENGRRRVEREFSWEKVGKRMEEYFRNVVA